MKIKLKTFEKTIWCTLFIIYDVVSLFWSCIIFKNLVYNISSISLQKDGIGIIGGADTSTFIFRLGNVLGLIFPIMIFLSFITCFLSIVSFFKKQRGKKIDIFLFVSVILTLITFLLIPVRSYAVALYTVVNHIPFLKHAAIYYMIISFAVILADVILTVKEKTSI